MGEGYFLCAAAGGSVGGRKSKSARDQDLGDETDDQENEGSHNIF